MQNSQMTIQLEKFMTIFVTALFVLTTLMMIILYSKSDLTTNLQFNSETLAQYQERR